MENGHITIEEFEKSEILRKNGYTVKIYTFTEKHYFYGGDSINIAVRRLIAYKEDMQHISDNFAYSHLLEDVFDEFVEKGE